MKKSVLAIIAVAMIASTTHAIAQTGASPSTDAILKRLDALERENRVLRERVHLLETANAMS
jgi:hypothetical protein